MKLLITFTMFMCSLLSIPALVLTGMLALEVLHQIEDSWKKKSGGDQ